MHVVHQSTLRHVQRLQMTSVLSCKSRTQDTRLLGSAPCSAHNQLPVFTLRCQPLPEITHTASPASLTTPTTNATPPRRCHLAQGTGTAKEHPHVAPPELTSPLVPGRGLDQSRAPHHFLSCITWKHYKSDSAQ